MISFFQTHRQIIFIVTISAFLIATFVGMGAYVGYQKPTDAVATVGKNSISYRKYQQNLSRTMEMYREQGLTEIPEFLEKQIEMSVLNSLIGEELLYLSACDYGFYVSDYSVATTIKAMFSSDGNFDEGLYRNYVDRELRMKPNEFENDLRQSMMANEFRAMLVLSSKLLPGEAERVYMERNKSMKDFNKDEFSVSLKQEKAQALLNYYLNIFAEKYPVKNLLAQFSASDADAE